MCLNFRLNYLGEIKWRDWATTILFDRVWTLGDPCLWLTLWSAAADEDRSAARGMIPVTFIQISPHASSGSCFTVQNSWLSYQTYSHNENDTSLVTVVVKLFRWLYHIHICPIAPQNHPGENISLLQFNPLKINWTGSIMCCCLNQESCNTHW